MRLRIFWTFLALLAMTSACTALLGDFTVGADAVTADGGGPATEGGPGSDAATDARSDGPASVDAGCPTGQTACPSGCADLQKATTNCGMCGRDCNGGTCTAAICSPYVVAKQPTTGTVAKLATDGKRVLWADTGIVAIEQISAKGGAVTTLVPVSTVNGGVGPELALANGIVAFNYLGSGSAPPSVGIASVDMPDSGAAVFPGVVAVSAISLNRSGTRVVYVNAHGTASDLADCALAGRGAGPCGPGVGGGRFGAQTAADDGFLFFDLTQANITPSQSGLYLGPIRTDVVDIFTTDVASSLAVDGTWAYWTVSTSGGGAAPFAVKRTLEASPGTQLQTPVPTTPSPAFATDGANVYYWTGSMVASRPVAGGTEKLLAPAPMLKDIAVGAGLLVWTDGVAISAITLP